MFFNSFVLVASPMMTWSGRITSLICELNREGLQNSAAKMAASATGIRDSAISVTEVVRRHGNDAVADDSSAS